MFSVIRSYLPEVVNNNIMYCTGMVQCYLQYYVNNTFSASEITNRLYVGDLPSASNNEAMKEQGITHIVSVINGAYELFPNEFEYKIIHINDDPWVDIKTYFKESNEFIESALSKPDTKVMIHCQRGVSRSVTLLLAYLIYKHNENIKIKQDEIDDTIKKILEDVKQHRPIAEPNEGFINSLKLYVCELNNYTNK